MIFMLFIFVVFGTVEIIIKGKPTAPIRKLFSYHKIGYEFIRCPLCLGFWVGIFWGKWLLWDALELLPWYLAAYVNGCAGAGVSYFLHGLMPPMFEMEDNHEGE